MSVDRGLNIELVGRLPAQPTVEAQPVAIRLAGEEGAVAIDARHAQLVIVLRADGGRVQPGQGSAGRRWPAPLGNQPHLGSAARQVVRAGDPDNAAADDRDPEL